jgi:hypothetical protein
VSAAERLNDYLAQPEADDTNGREQHWVVDDPSRAEWALRKLAGIRRQQAENRAVAEEEKRRIADWLDDVNGTLARSAQFFEGLLTTWHRRVLDVDPDRKTVSLPSGELKARKQPDRWEFTDDFTAWAQQHRPDLVRVRVDVDRTTAKGHLERISAEAVVDVDSGDIRFTVTTPGE